MNLKSKRQSSLLIAAVGLVSTACEGTQRTFAPVQENAGLAPGSVNSEGSNGSTSGATQPSQSGSPQETADTALTRGDEEADGPAGVGTNAELAHETGAACVDGTSEPCGPSEAVGACQFGMRTCRNSVWGACEGAVLSSARDCSSTQDNDCDGQPDDSLDETCRCLPGSVEPCDEHANLDGRGPCRAGERSCVPGEGHLTSDWGACSGSVGPGGSDSCAVAGDDGNCDGIPNGGCACVEGQTVACGPDTDNGICQRGLSTCEGGVFSECRGAVFPARRDCGSEQDNDCDGRPDNTIDSTCTCVVGDVQACGVHPGRDGNGPCKAGQQRCDPGANNVTSRFGACSGSVGPGASDSCSTSGDDSNCDGIVNGSCQCIPAQGNGPCSQDPSAPVCNSRGQCVACQQNADCSLISGGRTFCDRGRCVVPPFCGDGIVNGNEICDAGGAGSTELGSCNPECTGFYAKKFLRQSVDSYRAIDLGGISGADAICRGDFGAGWKALLTGGPRRATVAPLVGDGQLDWVIHRYTHYFNAQNQLVWRTDGVPLLGVSGGQRQNVFAPSYDYSVSDYIWSGYANDWTTLPDNRTCQGWTVSGSTLAASFTDPSLAGSIASELCNGSSYYLLCVEQ